MADELEVRLSRLWDVGDRDIPMIAEATEGAMENVDQVLNSNLEIAFTNLEGLGSQFSTAISWFFVTLNVTTGRLGHAANAVKAVVADYATTDIELGENLIREVEEFIELRPEHAP